MKSKSQLHEELIILSASIAKILSNPSATLKLKEQLEIFLSTTRESLSDQAKEEIEMLEIELILPEVLIRLR